MRGCCITPTFTCERVEQKRAAKPRAILRSLVNCNDRYTARAAMSEQEPVRTNRMIMQRLRSVDRW
jgi:hypothetical protein